MFVAGYFSDFASVVPFKQTATQNQKKGSQNDFPPKVASNHSTQRSFASSPKTWGTPVALGSPSHHISKDISTWGIVNTPAKFTIIPEAESRTFARYTPESVSSLDNWRNTCLFGGATLGENKVGKPAHGSGHEQGSPPPTRNNVHRVQRIHPKVTFASDSSKSAK